MQGKNVPVGITHTVRNYAVTVIVLNVVLTFVFGPTLDINNYAHLGGLAGRRCGLILPPIMSIGGRDHRSSRSRALGPIAFSAVWLLLAVLQPHHHDHPPATTVRRIANRAAATVRSVAVARGIAPQPSRS